MQKVVVRLELHDGKDKKKALKTVSGISGVNSISIETKDKTLMTVVGDIDPVCIVTKLRKLCHTEIVSVGPPPKDGDKNKDDQKKDDDQAKKGQDRTAEILWAQGLCYYPSPMVTFYQYPGFGSSVEEDPNACVIC